MSTITLILSKVVKHAKKVVLFGALIGGVSMMSYATETTKSKVGPTIEKAQLEAVNINLDAVVAAITKVDPDWMKGMPQIKQLTVNITKLETRYFGYDETSSTWIELDDPYDPNGCEEGSEQCAYSTTRPEGTGPGEVPSSFNPTQRDAMINLLTPHGSSKAQYVP